MQKQNRLSRLPRNNLWALTITSLLNDISSEMSDGFAGWTVVFEIDTLKIELLLEDEQDHLQICGHSTAATIIPAKLDANDGCGILSTGVKYN